MYKEEGKKVKRVKNKVSSPPKASGTSDSDSDREDTTPPRRKRYKKKRAHKQASSSTSTVSVNLAQLTTLVEYVK